MKKPRHKPAAVRLGLTLLLLQLPFTMLKALREGPDTGFTGITAGYRFYHSYSQQDNGFPMAMGFPVVKAAMPILGAGYTVQRGKTEHVLDAALTMPGSLRSDNGTGIDFLLGAEGGRIFQAELFYRAGRPLVNAGRFDLRYSLNSGLVYESRVLGYADETIEQTRDIGFFFGPPGAIAGLKLNENWHINGSFHPLFHLPWFNTGKLVKSGTSGEPFYSSIYRSFYYQTLFGLSVQYKRFTAGLVKNDLVGFGSRRPDFNTSEMVHYKLDRSWQLIIGIDL